LLLPQRHFLFGKIIEPHHFTMSNTPVNTNDSAFSTFVAEEKQLIKVAQYRALQAVNHEQMALYWEIGRMIVERQQKYSWGKGVVEHLAADLQAVFPDTKGYSARNLWRMKQLFEEYNGSLLILPPVVAEIGWTHNIIILEKCKDENQRFFYLKMASRHAWSKAMR
jgi:predicted nuclease of restriction endonuclease-like (RecB) superfamily